MKKITQLIKKLTHKVKLTATLVAASVVLGGVAYAGYTPANRPVYDWNNPADRGGSMNGPVFNSFINTPDYGDERAFFDASLTDTNGSYKDVLPGVTSDGDKIVTLRTYIHNNANQDTNNGIGVAKNTKIKIDLPTGTDTMLRARSYISATNAQEVTDTTELVDTKAFSISYVPGSARIYGGPNGTDAGTQLSDSIVTTGAPISSDNSLGGDYLGCFNYARTVEIQVKINTADIQVDKKVRLAGQTDFVESVEAKPGDRIQWAIFVKNNGQATINNINVRDVLPPHVKLNSGSVKWYDAAQNGAQQQDAPLFDGGINFGSYGAGANFYVRFSTEALGDFEGCQVAVRNLAYARSDETPAEKQDFADVVIKKPDCQPPQKSVTCDSLTAPKLTLKKGESTTFTAQATAVNATINGYLFKVAGTTVQDGSSNTYAYTADKVGKYNVSVEVKSSLGNITNTTHCVKTVDVVEQIAPIYRCESLTLSKTALRINETVTVTVRVTAKDGATFKHATFIFGDEANDSERLVTNNIKDDVVIVNHAYKKEGSYSPRVKLTFEVNGKLTDVEDPACVAKLTVAKEQVLGVTKLPDTGAGASIAGIFAGVTAVGAAMHRRMTLRRSR